MPDPILLVGVGPAECYLLPAPADRHGLTAEASGTGKIITLQNLAHGLGTIGVPQYLADAKRHCTAASGRPACRPR